MYLVMSQFLLPPGCLPDPTTTHLVALRVSPDQQSCTVDLQTTSTASSCPVCAQPATRVHSRYTRQLADLPLATVAVRVRLHTRRFFCDHPSCARRIFTERLPSIVAPRVRRTRRLVQHHTALGLALGGRPGMRFAVQSACPLSRHQLLRDVRAMALPVEPDPTVIGVDDWAMRKGQTYGTIIVDLHSHQPLDLLPDRSAETLAHWLKDHPTVTHISRDRAQAYADGCTQGAPDAIQIADRWHLFHNMRDALVSVLEHYDAVIRQPPPPSEPIPRPPKPIPEAVLAVPLVSPPQRDVLLLQRVRRHQRNATIHDLHTRGWTHQAIATHLGVHPKTVRRQLQQPPDRTVVQRSRRSMLDPYLPYLRERWAAGCTNASQLFRELVDQGFTGKASIVRAWVATLRTPVTPPTATPISDSPVDLPTSTPWTPAPESSAPNQRQAQRQQRYATIQALLALGWEQRAIAAHLGVHPKTVSRQLRRSPDAVPERALRQSVLDPYLPYLLRRWEEGCTNASRLFRELVTQGFPGKISIVRAAVAALRSRHGQLARRVAARGRQGILPTRATLAVWMLLPPSTLTTPQQTVVQQLAERAPELATTLTLARAFGAMVRERQADDLVPWLAHMETCGIAAFARLARGMRQDEAAIRAALTFPWSNGPVEGTINRLKMIKRSMYGRAKLDLLRQRVLVRPRP
jgi:transposase